MAIRTYKVTLDTKNSIAPEPVFLRQGDKTGAVVIDATLMDNGTPISIDGLTPMFKANTADGQAVIADSTGFNIVNASGGEFTYQVPNALTAVPGKIVTAYFSLSDTSGSESTFDVAFVIKKAVDITQAQADDYITIVDETLQSLQQKIPEIHQPDLSGYATIDDLADKIKALETKLTQAIATATANVVKRDPNTGFIIGDINVHYGQLKMDSHDIGWTEWVYDEQTAIDNTKIYPANIYLVGDKDGGTS